MSENKKNNFIYNKDEYFREILNRWRNELEKIILKRKNSGKSLNLWLYMVQKIVIERGSYFNAANILSFARGFLGYPIYVLLDEQSYFTALVLLIIGIVTDFIDGHIARGFQQVTNIGKIADPLGDKVMFLGVWLYLIKIIPNWLWWGITVIEIILLSLLAIKPIIKLLGIIRPLGANNWGKLKFAYECAGSVLVFLALMCQEKNLIQLSSGSILYYIGLTSLTLVLPFGLASITEHAFPGLINKIFGHKNQ